MSFKQWVLPALDKDSAAILAEEGQLHPFLALMLTTRGIRTPEEAADFLLSGELEDDPFGFADMDAAVDRIQRAIDRGERIAVFGDYDADGVTSTVLLYDYLVSREANVFYQIPLREGEGYGLHKETVDRLAEAGAQLIVTVDNGVAAVEEVAYAASLGIDVVVTDHHQPQEKLPEAVAVVNPHRVDCGSQFKDYAGVGVAFKLVCALEGDGEEMLDRYSDLVALGTLADVMPLTGENRQLVRAGLRLLNRRSRIGLAALAEAAGVGGKVHTSTSAVFTLGPRINAAGRMGAPEKAARLLLSQDQEEARQLAEEIQRLNQERQVTEAAILEQVAASLDANPAQLSDRVLVLAGENWHHGVVGIIAARITERYGKPCIVFSIDGEEAKGSGRSVKGFSLFQAISACQELLLSFGGHELAAGVGLKTEQISAFREKINAYAAGLGDMPVPQLALTCKLKPAQMDLEKVNLLSALEPFGTGNPAPVFGLFGMRLDNITPLGGGKHLRLSLSRDGVRIAALKFQTTPEAFPIRCGETVNLAVTLEANEYKGTASLSVIIRDIRYADTRQEDVLDGMRIYDAAVRRDPLPKNPETWIPAREHTAALYRFLRQENGWNGSLEQLMHRVSAPEMTYARLRISLEILCEASLAEVKDTGDSLLVKLLPVAGKADLLDTPIMRFLHSAVPQA